MKRLLLIAACLAFLAGCTKEDPVVQQKTNLTTKATQAHLTIKFATYGNMMNFYIPEWDQYHLSRVAITLHNVYIWPYGTPAPDFGTGGPIEYPNPTWVFVASQDIIAEGALSENAYIHVTPDSYLDQNSIRISGSGYYDYAWTITGINIGSGPGTGGGDSGGGTNPPGGEGCDRGDTICYVNYSLIPSLLQEVQKQKMSI